MSDKTKVTGEFIGATLIAGATLFIAACVAFAWIVLSTLAWSMLGGAVGWAMSGHFAVWENKLGMSMAELGAMVGFVSAAFRVKLTNAGKF